MKKSNKGELVSWGKIREGMETKSERDVRVLNAKFMVGFLEKVTLEQRFEGKARFHMWISGEIRSQ